MAPRVVAVLTAVAALAVLAVVGLQWLRLTGTRAEPGPRGGLSLAEALGTGDTTGYARAYEPRPFAFPKDHGPHPDFRTEWWYFTGNLEADDGALFGFQLTVFRSALAPRTTTAGRTSAWATNQVYMAHLAVTDVAARRFYAFGRFARGAAGLAGAQATPFRVWVEDWSARSAHEPTPPSSQRGEAGRGVPAHATFPLRLRAAEADIAIDLVLERGKPIVLNGDRGLSRKGPEPGNASYYYSLTRMPTIGTLRIGGSTHRVHGASWMDREWSTSGLGTDLAGWDWFAVQLDDDTDLMIYQLRREDGSASPFSGGTYVDANGRARSLAVGDVRIDVVDHWSSPRDGTRYPSRWRLRVPSEKIDVEVTPLIADQELNLSIRYWEGTASVDGERAGRHVRGRAYVELVGY